jgi:serine/threonine-protein kinase
MMIGARTASWFIAVSWITAGFSGLLTAFLAYRRVADLNWINFIDVGILFALAGGIYRKSRICAILALAYYLINQVVRVRFLPGPVPLGSLMVGVSIFAALYTFGIVGTFAWHRARSDLRRA